MPRQVICWLLALPAAVMAALLIRTFLFEFIRVEGRSMRNTLQNGDILLVSKRVNRRGGYRRGDIVICRYPRRSRGINWNLGGAAQLTLTRHTLFVKRLIALPGDTLEIIEGRVFLNGGEADEGRIDKGGVSTASYGPLTLGRDQFFVMGDNRGGSNDSRSVGPISRGMIMGRAVRVLWPLRKITKKI